MEITFKKAITRLNNRLAELDQQIAISNKLAQRTVKTLDLTHISVQLDLVQFELLEEVFANAISYQRNSDKTRNDYIRLFRDIYTQRKF